MKLHKTTCWGLTFVTHLSIKTTDSTTSLNPALNLAKMFAPKLCSDWVVVVTLHLGLMQNCHFVWSLIPTDHSSLIRNRMQSIDTTQHVSSQEQFDFQSLLWSISRFNYVVKKSNKNGMKSRKRPRKYLKTAGHLESFSDGFLQARATQTKQNLMSVGLLFLLFLQFSKAHRCLSVSFSLPLQQMRFSQHLRNTHNNHTQFKLFSKQVTTE